MPQDPFYTPLPTPQTFVDGIFKGGGPAGIVYVGSLMALARNGIWFERVAGTSAGAITASIIAAGYNANDCDYLAAPAGVRSGPPDSLPPGVEPLDYLSLMDIPLSPGEVTLESRRNNLFYYAISRPTIDELLKLSVSMPNLEPFITQIVDQVFSVIPARVGPFKVKVGPFKAEAGPFKVKVLGQNVKVGPWTIDTGTYDVEVGPFPVASPMLKQAIRNSVENALKGYPRILELARSGLLSTDELRKTFADAAMSAALVAAPFLVLYLNFMGDGGLFKGDAFLRALRRILERKLEKSPVRFCDLKMEFACVACDITSHELAVYSSKTHPEMEVAEAVRRSMSIPLFFEPWREGANELVDGGAMDNFPLGLFLAKNNNYFENTEDDMQRVKIGFAVKGTGLGPPVQIERVLEKYMPAQGLIPVNIVEVACINRVLNTVVANLQDSPLLSAMLGRLKEVTKYYEISGGYETNVLIPASLDFFITEAKFRRMCSMGWQGAIDPINQGVIDGNLTLAGPLTSDNPYGS